MKTQRTVFFALILLPSFFLFFFPLQSFSQTVTFTFTSGEPSCIGAANGWIRIVPAGGVRPYSFSVDNGATWSLQPNFLTLTAGNYTIVVKDFNGIFAPPQYTTILNPPKITYTVATTGVTCAGYTNGTITITAAGGTPPYKYSINDGATYSTSNVFYNLAPSSGYRIRVKDAKLCVSDWIGATVSSLTPVLTNFQKTPVSCKGGSDGTITVSASGGNHGYEYSIDGGANYQASPLFTGLAAGTYVATARDLKGCPGSLVNVLITEPAAINLTLSAPVNSFGYNLSCNSANGQPNGKATVAATGGTAPYSFFWGNGETGSQANYLPAGLATVTLTDAKGCMASGSITLTEPPELQSQPDECRVVTPGYGPRACTSLSMIPAVGGISPYTPIWSNGQLLRAILVCPTQNTVYSLTITDAAGCQDVTQFNVFVVDVVCGTIDDPKVSVCHVPPGNPNGASTICIDAGEVQDHLGQGPNHPGCRLGPCEVADPCGGF
ncbi:MAG: SprB repeat-containing protein [Bacteroidia bacterium]|nr:SprB repeat-containing protein [Bacteroidia bacterium]